MSNGLNIIVPVNFTRSVDELDIDIDGLPSTGLLAYYRMLDNGVANDAAVETLVDTSGNGNDATLLSGYTAAVQKATGIQSTHRHGVWYDTGIIVPNAGFTIVQVFRPTSLVADCVADAGNKFVLPFCVSEAITATPGENTQFDPYIHAEARGYSTGAAPRLQVWSNQSELGGSSSLSTASYGAAANGAWAIAQTVRQSEGIYRARARDTSDPNTFVGATDAAITARYADMSGSTFLIGVGYRNNSYKASGAVTNDHYATAIYSAKSDADVETILTTMVAEVAGRGVTVMTV